MDRFLLQRKCKKCQELMHMIMGIRLNREKHDRIDFIFSFISNTEFIKYVFDSKAALNAAIIKEIITDLGSLAREGLI
ncbi:hypothetical protein I4U23_017299 [Adineta vaga]|nr:hypothetical protein I4U23_017299 [Adineta vaga]